MPPAHAPILVRPARPEDEPAVARLAAQVLLQHCEGRPDVYRPGDPLPHSRYRQLLGSEATALLVACQGGQVVGYALINLRITAQVSTVRPTCFCYMDDLCVAEEAQGAGVGRQLFLAACQWGRERGARSLQLTVWEFNGDALSFYRHMGMQTRNRRMELPL